MNLVSITGAMIIIIIWLTLIEFDNYPEAEQARIIQKIKHTPAYLLTVLLMPLGIVINTMGNFSNIFSLATLGTALIFLQAIIIAALFWKRKRWKSLVLFIIVGLAMLVYFYLFYLLDYVSFIMIK